MQVLSDRVAYLKGLAEGLSIDAQSKEGRLIGAIIDVLGDVVKVISDLKDKHTELDEYVESIDEDLAELEEALLDDEDGGASDDLDDDDDDDDDSDAYDGLIEYECPHCAHTVYFDAETFDLEEENKCPNCGKAIFDVSDYTGAQPPTPPSKPELRPAPVGAEKKPDPAAD
ncbi:MAG: zinc ribbon domain-containing protein [Oscillospiraceae bacterium]|jgi:DNA-directed RNA polymerase subunit RPC12/RpoP|nr:zinc ribbon domain-containing protein [Oscillospiraceae bacterium]